MGDNQQKWGYAGDNNHNNPMMVGIQKKMTFRKNFSIRSNGMTSNSLGRDWSLRGESKNKSVLAGSFNPSPNITDGCWQCKMYIFNNIQIIIDYNIYIYNYVCMYVCIYICIPIVSQLFWMIPRNLTMIPVTSQCEVMIKFIQNYSSLPSCNLT